MRVGAGLVLAWGGCALPPAETGTVETLTSQAEPESGCAELADNQADLETEVLTLVNARRQEGADCGDRGAFAPAAALVMNDTLRCVARAHSYDMAQREFFDHTNPDGDGPGERVAAAGYAARTWGENIALGQVTPAQVMNSWMGSDGHCANIMNPSFTELGVGYHPDNVWTQVFATPIDETPALPVPPRDLDTAVSTRKVKAKFTSQHPPR